MGTVLTFRRSEPARSATRPDTMCEIIIFPGVRIERDTADLPHRLDPPAGRRDAGVRRRRRKTS